jgi:hypothetical protein
MNDKGQVTADAPGGGYFEAYRTHYRWDAGLTVRDWRYIVRVANIDVSELSDSTNGEAARKALIRLMIQATERIPNLGMGRAAFYCNRTIRTNLRLGILDKISNNLAWESVAGKRVMVFDDIPVRTCDAIINSEARVA